MQPQEDRRESAPGAVAAAESAGVGTGVSVAVAGLGNIGSHLVPHLARMPEIARIAMIDKDVYSEKNIHSQEILRRDVGKPKAIVQARRLRQIRPDLSVSAIHLPLEDVPLGLLRCDAILACLDSRAARQVVNEAAFRLGVPWIDAGVEPRSFLARVNAYVPGPEAPCLECAWIREDYEALEQVRSCQGGSARPRPTDGPSCLGALAASLQAIELKRLLGQEGAGATAGRQVLLDAWNMKIYVARFLKNGECLFDHARWEIERLSGDPRDLTLERLFAHARSRLGGAGPLSLRPARGPFVRRLVCSGCGRSRDLLRLLGRIPRAQRACPGCGREMSPTGQDAVEAIPEDAAGPRRLRRPLGSLGLRPGDVVAVRCDGQVGRFELPGGES